MPVVTQSPMRGLAKATSLILFSLTVLIAAMNPEQIQQGKLPGYFGSPIATLPGHGDIVTQTYCFCKKPNAERTENPGNKDLGSVIQIEYYNHHMGATFAHARWRTCHHSNEEELLHSCFMYENDYGDIVPKLNHWDGESEPLERWWGTDNFKFVANTYWGGDAEVAANYMHFNGRTRNLGQLGGQGYEKIENSVQDICALECQDFAGMFVANSTMSSHPSFQILDTRVDNICPMCRA